MLEIGKINHLEIYRIVEFGAYLTDGKGGEVLLPKKYLPEHAAIGTMLDVFLYTDSEDRPVATTLRPAAMAGEVALLPVIATTRVGAFLDWDLEKDLFWPFGEQISPVIAGKKYLVKVLFDPVSKRMLASNRFGTMAKKIPFEHKINDPVNLTVWERHEKGYRVLINDIFPAMLFKSDIFQDLLPGDRIPGYVKNIRPDGKIDVTLRRGGFDGIAPEREKILQTLRQAGGFLPYGNHSTPQEIQRQFAMSKKTFKIAIGNLYKSRMIAIEPEGIRLLDDSTPQEAR